MKTYIYENIHKVQTAQKFTGGYCKRHYFLLGGRWGLGGRWAGSRNRCTMEIWFTCTFLYQRHLRQIICRSFDATIFSLKRLSVIKHDQRWALSTKFANIILRVYDALTWSIVIIGKKSHDYFRGTLKRNVYYVQKQVWPPKS